MLPAAVIPCPTASRRRVFITVVSFIPPLRGLPCTAYMLLSNIKIIIRKLTRLKHLLVCFVTLLLSLPGVTIAQQKNLDYFLDQGLQNSPLLKETNNNILLNHI